ncbi:hypothetical protein [Nonomuraea soli]|uniref:Nucleotidyltransferase domain-containing protein n=1 Tax=Nonomuraea soli TaxID=1032476 RepID=A0A7W0CMA5_9ACTN|nr:hypothetical protein [Nonomuraea soli]MBA2893716.1 hypothetical protein [Nonomuraea soli]
MKIGEARAVAADWVLGHRHTLADYGGAYLSGSAVWAGDDEELPASSDVDVMVLTPDKLGKFRHRGVLIEVSAMDWGRLGSAEQVLGSYHVAGAFRPAAGPGTVIDDPTGRLTALRLAVAPLYGQAHWIRRRCSNAEEGVVAFASRAAEGAGPWPQLVTSWLFGCGVTTHVLLTAGLRNPTVRKRYSAVLDLLRAHGMEGFHTDLLDLLGCADWTPARARHHLDALTEVFDRTALLRERDFPFAADLTAEARPVAIDGSRELIERGEHRESVFWIVATYSRCLQALGLDSDPGFEALLADLGVDRERLPGRARAVLDFLPRLRERAEAIIRESADTPPEPGRSATRRSH